MKKLIIILLSIIFINAVYAENPKTLETIHLNIDDEVKNVNAEKERINNEKLEFKINGDLKQDEIYDDSKLYQKKTTTYKKEKEINDKMTVGAQYDTTIEPENLSQTRTLYSKYKMTDKMSVDTSYKNNALSGIDGATKGTVSVAPEYKVNKHLRFRNIFGHNLGDKSDKAELQMKVQPFDDDRMDLSVGAGQVKRDDGGSSSSQINFGTNIKF